MSVSDKLKFLKEKKEKIALGGGVKKIEGQHKKGKLTARERLNLLFDEGTFVEIDAFVIHRCTNFGMGDTKMDGESVVTGYGQVDGRIVYAFAQDFTVIGGSLGEKHADKIVKVLDNAAKVGAPVIGLNDSGGARIQEAIDALNGYGEIFFRNSRFSGVVPQISAIMGPCAGGAVYSPALTDFVFMVDQTSQMFITGPNVIKAVTGEEVSAEQLGGANTHNSTSGCAHFMSQDDEVCIAEIRRLLSFLPSNNMEMAPEFDCADDINREIAEFDTIIPDSPNKAYNMFDIIAGIVDDGDYMEYMPLFAKNIITAFARINGKSVGIIANQPLVMAGCLDINCSDKCARFIRTCDAFNIPLLTICDTPGYLPGTAQEYGGIIRHGAKILYAYSEATVPKITLVTRKSYGGANLAMCAKSLGADMVFAWPSAEIAVMGADGAVNVIFAKEIKESKNPEETRKNRLDEYNEAFSNPYKAAERGFVDDVIVPSTSRKRIVDALNMLEGKRDTLPAKKHDNLPL